jgi:hypothetical protein
MHVPSNRRDCPRQRWRGSIVAVSMLALSLGGAAPAASFDEKVAAPMMKSTDDLRSKSEPFAVKYRALRETNPEQLVRDAALERQKFDLRWQLVRAVETGKISGDVAPLGLVSQGDGSYRIELSEYPEWDDLTQTIAGMLSAANLDANAPALVARGFRPEDVVILKNYVAANDAGALAATELLPITLDFVRVVRKYDKLKRPVPDALVESLYYQRARVVSEVSRRWVEGLLQALDAQRGRILLSNFLEPKSFAIWAPGDEAAGRAELLAEMRKPDFEARAKAEAQARGATHD